MHAEVHSDHKKGRRWRDYTLVLTDQQLLFCRDPGTPTLPLTTPETASASVPSTPDGIITPDEIAPLFEVIAVKEVTAEQVSFLFEERIGHHTHLQTPFTFCIEVSHRRHFLLEVDTEDDMNDWILLINYASTMASLRLNDAQQMAADATLHSNGTNPRQRASPARVRAGSVNDTRSPSKTPTVRMARGYSEIGRPRDVVPPELVDAASIELPPTPIENATLITSPQTSGDHLRSEIILVSIRRSQGTLAERRSVV